MIGIIDYDAGNLRSVEKALLALGETPIITRDRDELINADRVILPGVGSFGDAMSKLHQYQLVGVIHDIIEKEIPFLGICLGLQLLFEGSEECNGISGLGILEGQILRIPDAANYKVPHMGWNSLDINSESKLFRGIDSSAYVYFVHSYYLKAKEKSIVTATTEYGVHIHAAVEKGNVFACQFHPEKSSKIGLEILKNFIKLED